VRRLTVSSAALAVALVAGVASAASPVTLERKPGVTFGPIAATPSYLVYARGSSDDEPVPVEEINLRTHRKTQLAATSVPSFGIAATAGWAVFAVPVGTGAHIVAVRHGSTRLAVLSKTPLSPVASRGDRVAWAEEAASRERVIVRTMTTGREWIAADLPRCSGSRCYRIDYVTLADDGVAFDRGAIGPQPSLVIRRRFGGRPETAVVANDPQPDLVPSYAGAYFFAFGRGWRRWDFGRPAPQPTAAASPSRREVLALERQGLVSRTGDGCHPKLLVTRAGRTTSFAAPRIDTHGIAVCGLLTGYSLDRNHVSLGWSIIPKASLQAHSDAGNVGILSVHPLP
jgi:hypothetical protein